MKLKANIKSIVENQDTKLGRWFDYFIQIAIIVSIVSFSIETLPNVTPNLKFFLTIIEIVTVIIFTAEYVTRIWIADSKFRYIFSFYGMIDLIAIAPFYLSMTLDARSLRVFRLLRLLRLLKLLRYNNASNRLYKALMIVKEELILFLLFTFILLYFSAVGIYYFEFEAQPSVFSSVFHSLWWSVSTLTTVGYGDAYPITVGGKMFTFFILIIGLGIIAVPASLLSSALSQIRSEEKSKRDLTKNELKLSDN